MNRVLRVGLVGFGAVARVHYAAYQQLAAVKIVGVTDTDPKQVADADKEFGLPVYRTLDEMLAGASLDIACVLTPPAVHEEVVSRCAAARVHVLCEKPLAVTVEACERMIAACRAAGVRLCYGASYRYLPALIAARDMIRKGELGQILIAREYAVGGLGGERRCTLSETHYPQGGPGGSGMGLVDHGIHLIDAFAWLLDSSVIAAHGRGNITGQPQGPEFAHLEYANGAVGQLLYEDGTYSTDLPQEGMFGWAGGWSVGDDQMDTLPGAWQSHPGCIHIHGTQGSLRIFHYANIMLLRDKHGIRQVRLPDQPFPGNFGMQLTAFAEAIQGGGDTPVPGEVGLQACRTLLQIYADRSPLVAERGGHPHG